MLFKHLESVFTLLFYYVNSLHLIVISRKGSEFIVTLTEWKHKSVKITDVHMLIQRKEEVVTIQCLQFGEMLLLFNSHQIKQ